MSKICVMGVHGTGKSTICQLVKEEADRIGTELEIIQEVYTSVRDLCKYPKDKLSKGYSMCKVTMDLQIEIERHAVERSKNVLCDRSYFDALAYYYLSSREKLNDLRLLSPDVTSYDKIFYLKSSPEFEIEKMKSNGDERVTDREQRDRLEDIFDKIMYNVEKNNKYASPELVITVYQKARAKIVEQIVELLAR